MPLFEIQDGDDHAFVVAKTYGEAVDKWRAAVARRQDGGPVDLPFGVSLLGEDDQIIVGSTFLDEIPETDPSKRPAFAEGTGPPEVKH